MKQFRKNYRVLKELVRLRFQNLMMFKIGFFGPFFVDGSLFAVQLLVFQAVYSNVERIGSWGKGEMIIYIGTYSLLNAVNMVICFFGICGISGKIKNGEMDLYLTKPVSPLFRISLERINPGSIPLVIMSVCIIFYGIHTADMQPGGKKVLCYLFWLLIMQVFYYDMEVLIRSIAFYTISTAKMEQLEEACLDLCMKLPGIAFYGIYKFIFYCILPYGIMATLPVQSLIGEMSLGLGIYGILAVCIFTGVTAFLWKNGIRHYNSASS
ncbi:MAG: ABC-2 family transporter protein [Lachnospiraceae bacterium]|nr:ABC-2 family transporter protein [Lachnospiraceae bacterium]